MNSSINPRRHLLTLLIYLLLSSFPWMVVHVWHLGEAEKEYQQQIRPLQDELNKTLAHFNTPHSLPWEVRSLFKQEALDSLPAGDPVSHFKAFFARKKQQFPGCFEFAAFHPDGTIIPEISDLVEHHSRLSEFGRELRRYLFHGDLGINQQLPRYRAFLGPLFPDLPARPYFEKLGLSLMLTSLEHHRAQLYLLFENATQPWFMAWLSLPPNPESFDCRFRLSCLPAGWQGGLIDVAAEPASWAETLPELPRTASMVLELMSPLSQEIRETPEYLWGRVTLPSRKIVILAVPNSAEKFRQASVTTFFTRSLGFIAVLGGVFLLLSAFQPASHALRVKGFLIFLYTAAMPLLLLFLSGRELLFEHRQTAEKRVFQRQEEYLQTLPQLELDDHGRLERRIIQHRDRLWNPASPSAESVRETVRAILGETVPDACAIFDEHGRNLWETKTRDARYLPVIQFAGTEIARGISVFNGDIIPPEVAAKSQVSQATMESLGMNQKEFQTILLSAVNTIVTVTLGESPFHLINVHCCDAHGKLKFIILIGWGQYLTSQFLARFIRDHREAPEGISLAFYDHPNILPAGIPLSKTDFIPVLPSTHHQHLPKHHILIKDGRRLLMTGFSHPSHRITLLAYSGDERIENSVNTLRIRLTGVGLFILFLGTGVGIFILRRFFRPLGFLTHGVTQIRERRFQNRLPVFSPDEFGKLSEAFNTMMEGMADLEIGRIVQETFFPQAPLRLGQWEIMGTSVSASRVGGDYFDYVALPDGRWLILIGDVSGHGVPAALVVGMAKALLVHPSTPSRPSQILELMNAVLSGILKRKRMMSCFIAVFDPVAEIFTASNAGHNYPFLVGPEKAEEIVVRNTLLGVKNRLPFSDVEFSVAAARAVCFYTDGLVEALTPQGDQVGYTRFQQALPGLLRGSAPATESGIREWFGAMTRSGPLEDDVTLVVLQRVPLPATNHPA